MKFHRIFKQRAIKLKVIKYVLMMVDDPCFKFKDGFFFTFIPLSSLTEKGPSQTRFFIRMGTAEKCDGDLQPHIFYGPFYRLPRGYFRTVMP